MTDAVMHNITLDAKTITFYFTAVVLCLTALHIATNFIPYHLGYGLGSVPMFDLDAEANIPTLYSSLALLCCSALLTLIASLERKHGTPYYAWAGSAMLFLVLSVDEGAALHEYFSISDAVGVLRSVWVIPLIMVAAFFALVFGRVLINLPARTRYLVFISSLTYVLGALVVDLIGGFHFKSHGVDTLYLTLAVIEELLEMAAVVILIYALLSHISADLHGRRLSIAFL
ncbi:MAG: hypothetical protein ACREVE_12230 [Gammaproteobacteria bacterium]